MEIIPKLANIVVLGNFNPAILTINFLQDTCKIPLKDPKKEFQSPIDSYVNGGNISFIASFDRFVVSETDLTNFENTKINEYVKPYLEILKYTPLQACGMNLEIDFKGLDSKIFQKYFISDHFSLANLLKAEELTISNDLNINKKNEEVIQYSVRFLIRSPDISGNISIKVNSDKTYNLKYNYEIRTRSDFGLIIENYQDRVKEFKSFIQALV